MSDLPGLSGPETRLLGNLAKKALSSSGPVKQLSSTGALWELLSRPFEPIQAVQAMLGLSPSAARHFVGRELLGTPEAAELVERTSKMVRHLRNQQGTDEVVSMGSIRGPVKWSSTIVARAASGFPDDLFVCTSPYRDFNLAENQLLLSGLQRLDRAGKHVRLLSARGYDSERLQNARKTAKFARTWADHQSFDRVRPANDQRSRQRTKTGPYRREYQAALAFAQRMRNPVELTAMDNGTDRRTRQQHKIFLAVLACLRTEGFATGAVTIDSRFLVSGPARFVHPGARGSQQIFSFHGEDVPHGISIGDLVLDVPDLDFEDEESNQTHLQRRCGDHPTLLVNSLDDVWSNAGKIVAAAKASERVEVEFSTQLESDSGIL